MTSATPTHHRFSASVAAAAFATAVTIGGVAAAPSVLSGDAVAGTMSPAAVSGAPVSAHPAFRHFRPDFRHFRPDYRHHRPGYRHHRPGYRHFGS
jgi:hypothetical protein